ncbi:hypothetical protein [Cedecea lapagei]|uniref:hypothetical protein n=1 Tax=Cedecea lapagei TaxID=158823 RepID=UPI000F84CBDB|nr:hypothetical protein [Cedecea lapagei]
MRSGGWAARITHQADYQPDVWEFRSVFRKPGSPVYASDVTEYQYTAISQRQGFFGVLPTAFISRDVINEATLAEIEGLACFDGLQYGNDLVFGESGFAHGNLLRGHNQYVGRSLKVNGSVYRDAYTIALQKLSQLPGSGPLVLL